MTAAPTTFIEVTVSGTFEIFVGSDELGIDGRQFRYDGVFDANSPPDTSSGTVDQYFGDATLWISGPAPLGGTHPLSMVSFWEEDGAPASFRPLGQPADFTMIPPPLRMVAGFDNLVGSPTNRLTSFTSADVDPIPGILWTLVPDGGIGDLYTVENLSASAVRRRDAWCDDGSALAGILGEPRLEGLGPLASFTLNSLELSGARSLAPTGMFLSLASSPTPFKGGTLKPVPWFKILFANTDGSGDFSLPFFVPLGVPSGTELWVQNAIVDSGAVNGVALSNAVVGTFP